MTSVVIDASAVIALLRDEPGSEVVEEVLGAAGGDEVSAARLSTVNLAEVHQQLGPELPPVIGGAGSAIEVVDFTSEQAAAAAKLHRATRSLGLSLADRACLALASRLDLPALTADRSWGDLDLGVDVQLIR